MSTAKDLQLQTLEHHAYREAGHAVMSYLIRRGYTDQYVPIDRSLILPAFQTVAIEGQSADWSAITSSLGSLVTASQVLLAGDIAERIKYDIQADQVPPTSPLRAQALQLTSAYMDEYEGGDLTLADRDREALQLLQELSEYVEDRLRFHWPSVEALAISLLENRTLPVGQVEQIIERDIPTEAKTKAQALRDQDPHQAVLAALEQMRQQRAEARQSGAAPRPEAPPPVKKAWWEFWK